MLDLIQVYKALADGRLDRQRTLELAAGIFPGADRELEQLLDRVDRDQPITL